MERKLLNFKLDDELYEDVYIRVDAYRNGGLAILLHEANGEPFADLTTFVRPLGFNNLAAVDTNNCPFAEEFILNHALGVKVGETYCGFCMYPIYAFNLDRLAELDPDGTKFLSTLTFDMFAGAV